MASLVGFALLGLAAARARRRRPEDLLMSRPVVALGCRTFNPEGHVALVTEVVLGEPMVPAPSAAELDSFLA